MRPVLISVFSQLLIFSAVCPLARSGELPRFSLPDTKGLVHTEREWTGKKAVVLIFIATDCPVSNGYVPELKRLKETYGSRGVAFYAVQSDATQSQKQVSDYANEYGYTFPVLIDSRQTLARFTGAKTTPEAAVLSSEGKVFYLGRIDDKYLAIGKSRYAATEPDLGNAIASVLSHHAVTPDRTTAVGCAIVFSN